MAKRLCNECSKEIHDRSGAIMVDKCADCEDKILGISRERENIEYEESQKRKELVNSLIDRIPELIELLDKHKECA